MKKEKMKNGEKVKIKSIVIYPVMFFILILFYYLIIIFGFLAYFIKIDIEYSILSYLNIDFYGREITFQIVYSFIFLLIMKKMNNYINAPLYPLWIIYLFLFAITDTIKNFLNILITVKLAVDPLLFLFSIYIYIFILNINLLIRYVLFLLNEIKFLIFRKEIKNYKKIEIEIENKINQFINKYVNFNFSTNKKNECNKNKKSIFFLINVFILLIYLILSHNDKLMDSYYSIYFEKNNGFCENLQKNDLIIKDNGKVIVDKETFGKNWSEIYDQYNTKVEYNNNERFIYYEDCK